MWLCFECDLRVIISGECWATLGNITIFIYAMTPSKRHCNSTRRLHCSIIKLSLKTNNICIFFYFNVNIPPYIVVYVLFLKFVHGYFMYPIICRSAKCLEESGSTRAGDSHIYLPLLIDVVHGISSLSSMRFIYYQSS